MKSIIGGILLFLGFLGGMLLLLDFFITWQIRIINLALLLLSFESIYFGTKFRESARTSSTGSLLSITGSNKSKKGEMILLICAVVLFLAYTSVMVIWGGFDIISICILALFGYFIYLHGESVFEARKRNRS